MEEAWAEEIKSSLLSSTFVCIIAMKLTVKIRNVDDAHNA